MSGDRIYPISRKRKKPPEQRETYCEELARHGDPKLAGEVAGYSPESARTLQYRPEVKSRVAELCAERLRLQVPKALNKLEALLDSDLPTVSLGAVREVLGRGGLSEHLALDVEQRQTEAEINGALVRMLQDPTFNARLKMAGFTLTLEKIDNGN